MRILQVAPYPTLKPIHGGQIRASQIAHALRLSGHTVKAIAVYDVNYIDAGPEDIKLPPLLGPLDLCKSVLSDYLGGEIAKDNSAIISRLRKVVADFDPQIIIVEQPWLFSAVQLITKEKGNIKLVYSSQNIEWKLKSDLLDHFGCADRKHLVAKIRMVEENAAHSADLVVACTEDDLLHFKNLVGRESFNGVLASNGVEPFSCTQERVAEWNAHLNKKMSVFVSSAHMPNVHGFWEMIGTDLSFLMPDEQIMVIGGVGSVILHNNIQKDASNVDIRKLLIAGVQEKIELQSLVKASRVVLLPITYGEGSNLKTAEALESGLPIVTTSKALRGYEDASLLEHVYIADDMGSFRAAMRMALDRPQKTDLTPLMIRSKYYWAKTLDRLVKAVECLPRLMDDKTPYDIIDNMPNELINHSEANGESDKAFFDCANGAKNLDVTNGNYENYRFPFGVNIIGYISGNLGLGVFARSVVSSLLNLGVNVSIFDIDPGFNRWRHDTRFDHLSVSSPDKLLHSINIFLLPPTTMTKIVPIMGNAINILDRINVLWLMWELPKIPQEWHLALQVMDLVMGGSPFVTAAISNSLDGPLFLDADVPHVLPEINKCCREQFSLPDDKVLFLSCYDPFSDPHRKNPFSAIEAFRRGVGNSHNANLVIKINSIDSHWQKDLNHFIGNDSRIIIFDKSLSYNDTISLYNSCDVFISLHRAEGLGLVPMEFMALGKPVIATAWSGNMAYMNADNSCLVSYKLTPVSGSIRVYQSDFLGADVQWAEPSIEDASTWVQLLLSNPQLRSDIGQKAIKAAAVYLDKASRCEWLLRLVALNGQYNLFPQRRRRKDLAFSNMILKNGINQKDSNSNHNVSLAHTDTSTIDNTIKLLRQIRSTAVHE